MNTNRTGCCVPFAFTNGVNERKDLKSTKLGVCTNCINTSLKYLETHIVKLKAIIKLIEETKCENPFCSQIASKIQKACRAKYCSVACEQTDWQQGHSRFCKNKEGHNNNLNHLLNLPTKAEVQGLCNSLNAAGTTIVSGVYPICNECVEYFWDEKKLAKHFEYTLGYHQIIESFQCERFGCTTPPTLMNKICGVRYCSLECAHQDKLHLCDTLDGHSDFDFAQMPEIKREVQLEL